MAAQSYLRSRERHTNRGWKSWAQNMSHRMSGLSSAGRGSFIYGGSHSTRKQNRLLRIQFVSRPFCIEPSPDQSPWGLRRSTARTNTHPVNFLLQYRIMCKHLLRGHVSPCRSAVLCSPHLAKNPVQSELVFCDGCCASEQRRNAGVRCGSDLDALESGFILGQD